MVGIRQFIKLSLVKNKKEKRRDVKYDDVDIHLIMNYMAILNQFDALKTQKLHCR